MQCKSMQNLFFNSYKDRDGNVSFKPKKDSKPVFYILPTYKQTKNEQKMSYHDKIIYFKSSEKQHSVKVKVPLNGIRINRNGNGISIGDVDVPIRGLDNANTIILFTLLHIYLKSLNLHDNPSYSSLIANVEERDMSFSLKLIVRDPSQPYYVYNRTRYHITNEMWGLLVQNKNKY
jgi:hypothetical protein